jgi:hypothetical protein
MQHHPEHQNQQAARTSSPALGRAPLPHAAKRQLTSVVAPRKTNAAVSAAPRKKEMTGRSLPAASPLATFQAAAMPLDGLLEGGEGGTQDDGSSEKNGMAVVCLYGSRPAAVLAFLCYNNLHIALDNEAGPWEISTV